MKNESKPAANEPAERRALEHGADRRARLMRLLTRAATIAGTLVLAGGAVAVPGASGVLTRAGGAVVSYQPLPVHMQGSAQAQPLVQGQASSRQLEYHGGPIMPSNANYVLFWAPPGSTEPPAGYVAGIDRYFTDLAHDSGGIENTDSLLTQYADGAGERANYAASFGGAFTDTTPYPASGCTASAICLTDAQLRSELTRYVAAQQLPTDLQHEYFVLTPPAVASCLEAAGRSCSAGTQHAAYCSYHGYISTASGVLLYANVPYLDGTNCDTGEEHPNDNASDAALGGGLVHEHSESVTDPELNAWYNPKKEEVADICQTSKVAIEFGEPMGRAPDGATYNQVIDGDLYWYQQVWSNAAGACEQRAALPAPIVKKVKPKSGPTGGGTAVTITGANFAAAATVEFGATAATEATVISPTTITATSPAGAEGTVDVTVTTGSGTSAIVKGDRFRYKKEKAPKR